jgi:hypothetical protein
MSYLAPVTRTGRRAALAATGLLLPILLLSAVCSVALAQWSTPVRVSRSDAWWWSGAIDSSGMMHAVWSLYPPDNWVEYACKPPNADTWTTPMHVTHDSPEMRECLVLCGAGDTIFVLWVGEYGGGIWLTKKCGDTWAIPTPFPGWPRPGSGLEGAVDRSGRIHIVWEGLNSIYDTIWYARYEAGAWTGPVVVATYDSTSGPHWYGVVMPDVAVDAMGRANVVYARIYDTLGPGYRRQSGDTWTQPTYPNGTGRDECDPRIALDTSGGAELTWSDEWRSFFSERTGDSWTQTERLDSDAAGAGGRPSSCVDRWNQGHVFYLDSTASCHGLRERVRAGSRWAESFVVDSFPGGGEAVASQDRLHMLFRRMAGTPLDGEVLYAWRPLNPPGIEDEATNVIADYAEDIAPLTPASIVSFVLVKPGRVLVEVIDSAGRRVGNVNLGLLPAGKHDFKPFGHIPTRGVVFLRIVTEASSRTVKVVRIN